MQWRGCQREPQRYARSARQPQARATNGPLHHWRLMINLTAHLSTFLLYYFSLFSEFRFSFVFFVFCSSVRLFVCSKIFNFSSRRRDSFGPKIVQIRPILTISWPFEDFRFYFGAGEKYLDVPLYLLCPRHILSTSWMRCVPNTPRAVLELTLHRYRNQCEPIYLLRWFWDLLVDMPA